jgi:ubiquinone/menaquinone biosynthesis C-methylase UbiE
MSIIHDIYYWIYRATSRPDERGERFGGRWQGAVRQCALELCKGVRGKVLEIGCGSGLFVFKLAAQEPDIEVWGVDNNRELVADLERKAADKVAGNLHIAFQDGKSLSFADGSFDRVVGINLFLNLDIDAVKALLKEMKRVCKRSGRIIFDFRSSRNPFFVLKYRLVRHYDATAPYPLYTHSPERIKKMLREAGLGLVNKKSIGFPLERFAPIIIVEAQAV